ncbi:hypothetical protein WISP_04853 [Willisornis vidua]|uniref:Uncharacterized protein n=1 Tax=Willisornis vidua TaxID=1566151 RepID=A0ABQ9DT51_9PASS|nr:hypothetical protein WISP_04853 [Willisornis vidua]
MPACSRLLPRIIPPANGEVEFQISGPQVHGSFETKLCQIYGFGVRMVEEPVAILREFCLELSILNRRLHFQIRAQKVCVACVFAKRDASLRKAKQAESTCPKEAWLPSPACKHSSPHHIYQQL